MRDACSPELASLTAHGTLAAGLYYVEYTLQNPGERRRHILSAIGMASNGWYNRLYTVTGQVSSAHAIACLARPSVTAAEIAR